eukprot:scaffold91639_cov15-Tisochrysis_lutea.AAC.1
MRTPSWSSPKASTAALRSCHEQLGFFAVESMLGPSAACLGSGVADLGLAAPNPDCAADLDLAAAVAAACLAVACLAAAVLFVFLTFGTPGAHALPGRTPVLLV